MNSRHIGILSAAAVALALAGCAHHSQGPAPQEAPKPLTASDSVRAEAWGAVPDPVGFLLEYHDSLDISDAQLDALRSINLDLFRHNARIQMSIDSLVPPPPPDYAYGRHPPELTAEQRARLQHLATIRADNIRRARADADSVLTPDQRTRAEALQQRLQQRSGNRRPR